MAKTVKLGDLSRELDEFTKKSLQEQQKAVANGMLKSLPELVKNSPIDTGQYASSWDFTVNEKEAVLGNFAPHAPIIELGARPFTPPLAPLLAWAKRVLKSPSQPPNYDDEVWALARGTQKKIEREGMKPRNILEKSIPMIIENIKKEFERVG